jgi:two-component system sensor histidine kinase DesK
MRIRDDGRGGVDERGNGLTGMRERIAAHGGELWIESPRGKGTGIEIRLPLPQAPVDRATAQKVVPITAAPLAQPAGSRA